MRDKESVMYISKFFYTHVLVLSCMFYVGNACAMNLLLPYLSFIRPGYGAPGFGLPG